MASVNMTLSSNENYYNISENYIPIHQLKNNTTKSTKIQPIAPAPPTNDIVTNKNELNSVHDYKKKYTYTSIPYGEQQQPQSVARRNARERNRVKQVNNGFATLRQHIPQTVVASLTNGGRGASKKLSKVDTLRIAVEYISRLQELIRNNESDSDSSSSYHSAMSTINSSSYEYYSESPEMKNENFTMRSPSYSDISTSPAPSSSSDQSGESNQYYQMQPMVMPTQNIVQPQYKYETTYNNYNSSIIETTSPEDEELLDYISLWQEQQ